MPFSDTGFRLSILSAANRFAGADLETVFFYYGSPVVQKKKAGRKRFRFLPARFAVPTL
jgi:hypothetical protein